jgi:hypothetical protein
MIECFNQGLIWRGLMHDLSKFLPDEFLPYANFFYPDKNCWTCQHIIKNGGQCDFNFAGIGDGEQAPKCKDYIKKEIRNSTGYYKPTDTSDKDFDFAWLLHQKRNRHHWQWWILPEDEGGIKVLPIEEPFFTEMICDWIGAGKAQGHFSPKEDKYLETRNWWKANNHKMTFHEDTKRKINKILF